MALSFMWTCFPLSIFVHFRSYQIWLWTYYIQIQYSLRIQLLRRVCGISCPLKFCSRQRGFSFCDLWEASLFPSNWFNLILGSLSCFYTFSLQNKCLVYLSIWYWFWVAYIAYETIYRWRLGLFFRQREYDHKLQMEASWIFVE